MPASTTPRRWLNRRTAATGTAVAAAFGAGLYLTGAVFTDQDSVTADVSTATVSIEAGTAATAAPINAADVLPGDTGATTIDVENTGSVPVFYMVEISDVSADAGLAGALDVTIASGGETTTRALDAFTGGQLVVATALGGGDTAPIEVSYAFDQEADNALQGTSASFEVTVHAVQARNVSVSGGWQTT